MNAAHVDRVDIAHAYISLIALLLAFWRFFVTHPPWLLVAGIFSTNNVAALNSEQVKMNRAAQD